MTQQIRTLATIGLPSDAAGLMPPMLRVLKGRTQFEWCVAEAAEARVVLVGPDAAHTGVEHWAAQGKLLVEVNRPGERRLGGIHSMELPVRMFALLSLLNDIEPLLASESGTPDSDSDSTAQPAYRGVSNFVEALRALRPATAAGAWLRSGSIYVRDNGLEFALHREHFEALQSGRLVMGSFEETLAAPPADLIRRPVEALAWYAGWALGGERLLPDLDAVTLYRLRRWPDFGTIGSQHNQIRLAAMLAGYPWSRDALARKSGFGVDYVTRFFNAATVAGLLEATSTPHAAPAAQPASGLLASIVRGVRQRLGLRA